MASTTEDVVVRYRAEVDQFTKELDAIILKQDEIIKNEVQQEGQAKKTVTAAQHAASKRKQLIIQEEAEIKKLRQLRALAFDPKQIEKYNSRISDSQKNIKLLRGETAGLGSTVKNVFGGIAAGIAAAFSVQAVIAFGKASIDAFLEAEENANRLKFAIESLGTSGEGAFERLIALSVKLQKETTFADDAIQKAATSLSNFGLNATQIEDTLPGLTDFASKLGISIEQAAEIVGQGLKGMGREFKKFGIDVSANNTELENLRIITEGFAKAQGAAAKDTETLAGQLKQQANEVDDLQEKIGEDLAPAWVAVKKATFEALNAVIAYFKAYSSINIAILNEKVKGQASAVEEVTQKVKEQTAELVKVGFTQEEASKNALNDVKAEILERLKLRIEQARFAADSTQNDESAQRRARLKLEGVRNELRAVESLIEADKERNQLSDRELRASDLKNKSIAELNALLKENGKLNDITAQSNVTLINRELEARKKLKTEHGEDIKEMQRLDSTYAQLNERQKQLVDLAVLGSTSLEDFRLKVRNLREEMEKEVKIPDTLTQDPARPTDTPIAQPEFQKSNRVQIFLDENEQIISSTQELFNELASLSSAYADNRIEQINRTRDAELASLDVQQEAINKQLEKRRISETTAEALSEGLDQKRLAAEKKAADESRKIKRKAAILEKAAAIINITISTAEAVAKALTAGPYISAVLAAIYGALGAAQIALVASQPIPYKKGTKHARGGRSLVDEEGSEAILRVKKGRLTTLDKGDKVLTAKQTIRYADVIDAMYDNRLEQYLNYDSAPKLIRAKQKREDITQQSFAKNIAQSIIFNSDSEKMVAAINGTHKAGQRIVNVDELADAISKRISPDIYRR